MSKKKMREFTTLPPVVDDLFEPPVLMHQTPPRAPTFEDPGYVFKQEKYVFCDDGNEDRLLGPRNDRNNRFISGNLSAYSESPDHILKVREAEKEKSTKVKKLSSIDELFEDERIEREAAERRHERSDPHDEMWKDFVLPDDFPKYLKHSICKGDVLRCLTISIFGINRFYVHLLDQLAQFRAFEKSMINFYDDIRNVYANKVPPEGKLCIGMYLAVYLKKVDGEQPTWHRAQVIYMMDKENAFVQLIDYGHTVMVKRQLQYMRLLPRMFLLQQEAMAIPCRFLLSVDMYQKVKGEETDMGDLLRQYLSEKQAVEIVKFHKRSIETEPSSNRVVWVVTSMLSQPILERFPVPHQSVLQVLYDKFFNKGERVPVDQLKGINLAECNDWSLLELDEKSRGFKVVDDLPLYESWKRKELNYDDAGRSNNKLPAISYGEWENALWLHGVYNHLNEFGCQEDKNVDNFAFLQRNEYDRATEDFMDWFTSIRAMRKNDRRDGTYQARKNPGLTLYEG